MEDELIACPFCGQEDYIVERENSIQIITNYYDYENLDDIESKECKYFCTYCKKDF